MPYHCRDPKRDQNLDNHPYVLLLLYDLLTILADGVQSCSPVTMLVIVSIIVFRSCCLTDRGRCLLFDSAPAATATATTTNTCTSTCATTTTSANTSTNTRFVLTIPTPKPQTL